MKDLYRLIYTSARNKNCTEEEIQKILDSCKKNNIGLEISGVLLHTERRFLQVVEGDKATITTLYEKIKTDPRHGGVNLRYLEPIEKRAFPDWFMAYKDLSSDKLGFQTSIDNDTKKVIQDMFSGDISGFEDRSMKLLKTFMQTAA